jgi:hypothetical protein
MTAEPVVCIEKQQQQPFGLEMVDCGCYPGGQTMSINSMDGKNKESDVCCPGYCLKGASNLCD